MTEAQGSPVFDATALKAAQRLIRGRRTRHEDNIRQDLGRLLDAMDIDNLITYRTPDGPADLYLPRRRTVIETKRVGEADEPDKPQARENNESPREQLERYLRSELDRELGFLDLEGLSKRPWIGLVTDGRVWHAWRYAHEAGSVGQEIFRDFRPTTGEELVAKLGQLLSQEPLGKPWIPEQPASIFEPYRERLSEIRSGLSDKREQRTQTKQQLWLDVLRTSSMAPNNRHQVERLFVAHSFLITLARGVVHTLAAPTDDPDATEILKEGFAAWIIDSTEGRNWAQEVLEKVHSYEWRRRSGDVLRSVYEAFIEDKDRKIFGEYYTPDWLAALLVEEVCDEEWCNLAAGEALAAEQGGEALRGRGVLDPACGSGTFLYHAATRILQCQVMREETLGPERKAGAVARLVWGLDIHPIAVEIARATVLRALPAPPPDHDGAIRVHQGDSLMAQPQADNTLFTHTEDMLRFETPQGGEIHLPKSFARHRQFGANLRRLVEVAKAKRSVPADIIATIPADDRDAVESSRKQIQKIILKEGNSVWAWYIANITAPVRLAERKVDRIVANPPWVTMAEIQVKERKATLEAFSKRMELWDGGKQAPHHDIAQLFVKRCREQYLADPDSDPAAWLVKKAALTGGHWTKFREWYEGVGAQTLDLERARPFGGGDARRCCALFDKRRCRNFKTGKAKRLVAEPTSKLQGQMSLRETIASLGVRRARKKTPQAPSFYADAGFRQGASIVPSVLTKIDSQSAAQGSAQKEIQVRTVRSRDKRWSKINPLVGSAPGRWVRRLYTSNDLLAFWARRDIGHAIIPVDKKGRLEEEPAEYNELWSEFETIYEEHRSRGGNNPKTLRERIDYGSYLSRQLSAAKDKERRTVLYPKSSDIMRAARVAMRDEIVNDTLYHWKASSEEEAAYLVALLNAPALGQAFLDARRSGRDFHTHFWGKIPIPRFNRKNRNHVALAKLTIEAEELIGEWIVDSTNTMALKQVGLSKRIRGLLEEEGILGRIDAVTRRILPKQSSA